MVFFREHAFILLKASLAKLQGGKNAGSGRASCYFSPHTLTYGRKIIRWVWAFFLDKFCQFY